MYQNKEIKEARYGEKKVKIPRRKIRRKTVRKRERGK